jgi:DNA-binding CsgD family transcriptional regulator
MAGYRGLITDTDMFSPEDLRRDRYYNEFVAPHKLGATAGMVLTKSGSDLILPLTFERTAAQGPFQPAEIQKMNRMMAHLRPAATLGLQLGLFRSKTFADALGAIGKDVVLLSATEKVLHISPSCQRHFGDALSMGGGGLHSWHADADRLLAGAIKKVVQRTATVDRVVAEIALPRKSGGAALRAQLVPLVAGAQDLFVLARAAIIISDPQTATGRSANGTLARFGLTPAETQLALRVGAGQTLKAAAEESGVTLETARSRLKIVFAKTGTHRQAELAVLVMRDGGE